MRLNLVTFALVACLAFPGFALAVSTPEPEPSSPSSPQVSVTSKHFMAVTAHPKATEAAYAILEQGGNALDAAIAAQMVLGVVEPQSSGLGGGGFLLYLDKVRGDFVSLDGRETAPALAHENLFLDEKDKPLDFLAAAKSGRSVGTPGLLAMLELAHDVYGRLEWQKLLTPAIDTAQSGFEVSPRLAQAIALAANQTPPQAFRELYLSDAGLPPAVGATLKNQPLADTLRLIAEKGSRGFYQGRVAEHMVKAVRSAETPGSLSLFDLDHYEAIFRDPTCGTYREYNICSMGPPSSGAITLLQILGLVERIDLKAMGPYHPGALHLILEAEKLAFSDREHYIADPDYEPVPLPQLLSKTYLGERNLLISLERALEKAPPGPIWPVAADVHEQPKGESTTHLSIIDREGNIASLTSSVENSFGSGLMADGFMLNNQLTDFSFVPEKEGIKLANRMLAGKRPRSSMSPVIVFDKEWKPRLVLGSPGGSGIMPYLAKTLICWIDWGMPIQEAINAPHFYNKNEPVSYLEQGGDASLLIEDLGRFGHTVETKDMSSGIHAIEIRPDGTLVSGVDPRREGKAMGE